MSFQTRAGPVPAPRLVTEQDAISAAASKMGYIPEYKLLVDHIRMKAYKLLNDDLGSVDARNDHNRGRLYAYAEVYRTLTNGKELFDASTP